MSSVIVVLVQLLLACAVILAGVIIPKHLDQPNRPVHVCLISYLWFLYVGYYIIQPINVITSFLVSWYSEDDYVPSLTILLITISKRFIMLCGLLNPRLALYFRRVSNFSMFKMLVFYTGDVHCITGWFSSPDWGVLISPVRLFWSIKDKNEITAIFGPSIVVAFTLQILAFCGLLILVAMGFVTFCDNDIITIVNELSITIFTLINFRIDQVASRVFNQGLKEYLLCVLFEVNDHIDDRGILFDGQCRLMIQMYGQAQEHYSVKGDVEMPPPRRGTKGYKTDMKCFYDVDITDVEHGAVCQQFKNLLEYFFVPALCKSVHVTVGSQHG